MFSTMPLHLANHLDVLSSVVPSVGLRKSVPRQLRATTIVYRFCGGPVPVSSGNGAPLGAARLWVCCMTLSLGSTHPEGVERDFRTLSGGGPRRFKVPRGRCLLGSPVGRPGGAVPVRRGLDPVGRWPPRLACCRLGTT